MRARRRVKVVPMGVAGGGSSWRDDAANDTPLGRAVFDRAPEAMVLVGADACCVAANAAACAVLGVTSPAAVIGQPLDAMGSSERFDRTRIADVAPGVDLWVLREVPVPRVGNGNETELRFRRLMHQLPEAVLIHVDRKIAYAYPAGAHIAGLGSPEAFSGPAMRRVDARTSTAPGSPSRGARSQRSSARAG